MFIDAQLLSVCKDWLCCHTHIVTMVVDLNSVRDYRNYRDFNKIFVIGQGFMQDKIIASHTCFGGHMDVNC